METAGGVEEVPKPQVGKKDKRFKCPHCQRLFARLEHLQRHERIHSGVKPFSCTQCNYSFTRSDLLVRHERLTHRREQSSLQEKPQPPVESNHYATEDGPRKRMRANFDAVQPDSDSSQYVPATSFNSLPPPENHSYSLTALSMAAEYQALHRDMVSHNHVQRSATTSAAMDDSHVIMATDQIFNIPNVTLEESLDNLASLLDNEPLSTYHFASMISTEQPMPFFSPDSLYTQDMLAPRDVASTTPGPVQHNPDEAYSLSRFGSRFPSLQPEDMTENGTRKRPFADISQDDRQKLLEMLKEFSHVIPSNFKLPTRLALCRYITAYINGFHEHMPFLHIPTMSVQDCSIELTLALAAVGAQYTFEGEKGVELFNVSRSIATQRIRRRDSRLVERYRNTEPDRAQLQDIEIASRNGSITGPLGSPSEPDTTAAQEELIQTAQALLLLMALCTWAKHKEILREALAVQSVLATLIRDDGLQLEPLSEDLPWLDWIQRESIKRTKFIVYGFSNLHCIVYNIPPFMLTSEVKLTLPCSTAEFKAPTEALWREARKKSAPEVRFQDALKQLFSKNGREVTQMNSSSGNYALVHALIQHIFFLRQIARCRFDGPGDLSTDDIASLETALRNWQMGRRRDSESSLDPSSPNGPVAFNSTALLRLAYIRLYVDTAGRDLETRDPELIANAFRTGPVIKRCPKITRAVIHSAQALSIPIKVGYRLVARTQSFIWSIQHSLCTLECAYLMSKWLEALTMLAPDPPLTKDEGRLLAIIKNMLDETEFAVPSHVFPGSPSYVKHLNAGVLRVWAMIFRGSQTWAIVDVIGSALNMYADMLETG